MPLFEVAILQKQTKKESEDGQVEKLVFGPKAVVARDGQAAGLIAVLNNQQELKDVDTSRLEVLVRPFA